MKSSKLWMILIVAVLILSFAVTTVGAQSGIPPVGEVDEDGDLIADVFPQVDVATAGEQPNLSDLAAYADFSAADGQISVDISTPISPDGYIYTKYPTFKFSQDAGALKYQIEVYDILAEPDVLIYRFKGSPNCEAGVCQLTPTTALKSLSIFLTKGLYGWHVRSKTAGGWSTIWSAPAYFAVLKNGFNSTFTTLDSKWFPVYGTWTITSTGYAKTKGQVNFVHSAIEKHPVTEGFVYEVKMKHKDDLDASNRVYFLGYPTPLDYDMAWYDGYLFIIRNNGVWQLNRMDDGAESFLISGNSPYLEPYDWNRVTVMVGETFIDYWLNGTYIGYVTRADTFELGYVGFGAFSNIGSEAFLVDHAWLEYTTAPPYPWPWSVSADNQRDPTFELKLTEAELGKDLTVLP